MGRELVVVGVRGKPLRVGWGGHVPWGRLVVVLHAVGGESSLEAVAVAAAEGRHAVSSSSAVGVAIPV